MNMKEVQLLGILAVIAGGIIVLSLWGSQPNTRETGNGEIAGDGAESAKKTDASQSQDGDMEDWEWLTREAREDRHETGETDGSTQEDSTAEEDSDETQKTEGHVGLVDGELPNDVGAGIDGVAPADIGLEKAESSESDARETPRTHTVEKGETLTAISEKYYNTSAKWKDLFEANKDVVESPKTLRPGTEIVIPSTPESESAAREDEDEKPLLSSENEGSRKYEVKKGDTLWSLAEEFYGSGNERRKITEANENVSGPDDLRAGMEIVIPE